MCKKSVSTGVCISLFVALLPGVMDAAPFAYRLADSFYEVSESVVTPHIAWAKPYYGGPVKALIIAPRWAQRETIELAQRLGLDYTTCMTWSSSRLGGIADGPVYRRAQGAMAEDVAAEMLDKLKRDYDVIVVGNVDWRILPREVEYAILKKVHDGTGLVCANHAAGHTKTLDRILALEPVRDDAGFISRGVPLRALPALDLRDAGQEGIGRILALRQLKRGRVAFLGYPGRPQTERGRMAYLKPKLPRFAFLTPAMGFVGERELLHYEYYLSLGIKTILWAAGKEPAVHIEFVSPGHVTLNRDELPRTSMTIAARADRALQRVRVRVAVRDELNNEEHNTEKPLGLQQGRNTVAFPMPSLKAGRHFIDAFVVKDGKVVTWGSSAFDVRADVSVDKVALDKPRYEPGGEVRGKVLISGHAGKEPRLQLSVVDTLGRVTYATTLAAAGHEVPFAFRLERPLTIVQRVWARLVEQGHVVAEASQEFSVPLRRWDDHAFMVWAYDFGPYSPTECWVMRLLKQWGVDISSNCAPRSQIARGHALANLSPIPYMTRYAAGKVEPDLVRRPCLTDSSWQQRETARLVERTRIFAPYGPFAYSLGDENFLGPRGPDICLSETCQTDFRKYLARTYRTIDNLNREYGTDYKAWDEVAAVPLAEARAKGQLPLWADHRMHMEEVFVSAHRRAVDAIKRVDPTARVGFDGPAGLSSWSGMNWWEFAKFFDLINIYFHKTVDQEIVRSFARKGTIVCAWYGGYFYGDLCGSGWQRKEDMQRFFPWWMAFHGATATSWYNSWGTIENGIAPDLRPYPCFEWAIEEGGELGAGVGKLLLNSKRQHDHVAVHYSQASTYASTIDQSLTSVRKSRRNVFLALEDIGLQYEFLSYEQIEKDALSEDGWRVLVLPYSQALSGQEAQRIREFVHKGGFVLADMSPGVMDAHCKRLPAGALDDVFGLRHAAKRTAQQGAARPAGTVDAISLAAAIPEATADAGLTLTTGRALATVGNTPVAIVNRFGAGRAVCLNLALDRYAALRREGQAGPVKDLLRRLLELAGVRSRIKLHAATGEVKACEIVRFRDGQVEYVGLMKSKVKGEPAPLEAHVVFPGKAHVYDVREKRHIGLSNRVRASITPWRAKLYALLPYEVAALTLTSGRGVYQQGEVAALKARLKTSPGRVGTHCIRFSVSAPYGAVQRHYSQNVLSQSGEAAGEIAFALNDPPGRWRLRADDVVSGQHASLDVELRPRPAGAAPVHGPPARKLLIRDLPAKPTSARTSAQPRMDRVGVSVGGLFQRKVGYGPLKGHTYRSRSISFAGVPFALRWMDVVGSQGQHLGYEEGYIGMPGPSAQNWYHGGFLFLFINGRDLGRMPVKHVEGLEQGQRGSADMIWDAAEAAVRARFVVHAGDDRLFVEIALKPKVDIKSLRVETVCYPSLFTSHLNKPGRRHVIGPTTEARQDQPFAIDPSKDAWLLYADDVHDVANGSGVGPCAMAFLPDQVDRGEISIGSYPVRTVLHVKPHVRLIRMAFWDLRGMTNAEALAKMRKTAAPTRSRLAKMDFTILAASQLDLPKRRREVDGLIRRSRAQATFTPIFGPLFARLAVLIPEVRAQQSSRELVDPAKEREIARILAKLADAEQDLRFAALFGD